MQAGKFKTVLKMLFHLSFKPCLYPLFIYSIDFDDFLPIKMSLLSLLPFGAEGSKGFSNLPVLHRDVAETVGALRDFSA